MVGVFMAAFPCHSTLKNRSAALPSTGPPFPALVPFLDFANDPVPAYVIGKCFIATGFHDVALVKLAEQFQVFLACPEDVLIKLTVGKTLFSHVHLGHFAAPDLRRSRKRFDLVTGQALAPTLGAFTKLIEFEVDPLQDYAVVLVYDLMDNLDDSASFSALLSNWSVRLMLSAKAWPKAANNGVTFSFDCPAARNVLTSTRPAICLAGVAPVRASCAVALMPLPTMDFA